MRPLALLALLALAASPALAQRDFSKVEIRTTRLTDSTYMLTGSGGNIGLSVGEDAVFLVDDQYAPLTERIKAAIAKITAKPVRFVLNTHWHGDHVGGNENFAGAGAILVAHENVRQRMGAEQFVEFHRTRVPPSPGAALPVVTFTDGVTFHLNGDEIRAVHVPRAHTDGDAIVHFLKNDVIHAGDVFWNGMYPFIDASSGRQHPRHHRRLRQGARHRRAEDEDHPGPRAPVRPGGARGLSRHAGRRARADRAPGPRGPQARGDRRCQADGGVRRTVGQGVHCTAQIRGDGRQRPAPESLGAL